MGAIKAWLALELSKTEGGNFVSHYARIERFLYKYLK